MRIIIIGKTPPPIGGVTIHVKRLTEHLRRKLYPFDFVELSVKNLLKMPFILFKYKKFHLHTSNPLVRLYFTILSRFLFFKSIITYHGNIGRFNLLMNFLDKLTLKYCNIPVVLNENSFKIAKKLNFQTKWISAFIPPIEIIKLPQNISDSIDKLRGKVSSIYCTNAYKVTYDKNKQEIYQISTLVELFKRHKDKGLIVSDPSGTYNQMLMEKTKGFDNILFIPYPHDFNAVILESDFMLRFTTTDGDSLSVKEALHLKKTVIASNVVSRPNGVILVNLDIKNLERIITTAKKQNVDFLEDNSINQLIEIYNSI